MVTRRVSDVEAGVLAFRCVWCRHCGATCAGLRCEWQNNYTQCAPCASLAACPVCLRSYREDDLILQCRHCDRCRAVPRCVSRRLSSAA